MTKKSILKMAASMFMAATMVSFCSCSKTDKDTDNDSEKTEKTAKVDKAKLSPAVAKYCEEIERRTEIVEKANSVDEMTQNPMGEVDPSLRNDTAPMTKDDKQALQTTTITFFDTLSDKMPVLMKNQLELELKDQPELSEEEDQQVQSMMKEALDAFESALAKAKAGVPEIIENSNNLQEFTSKMSDMMSNLGVGF